MKRILLMIMLVHLASFSFAAMSSYTFAQNTTTLAALSSPIQLHGTAIDDAVSAATDIGFVFSLDGIRYTSFKASTNGFISLNTTITSSYASNALATNPLFIGALWDDLKTNDTDSGVFYELTGAIGSRILKVDYKNMKWYYSASPVNLVNFQIWLYEGTNVVEFHYGTMGSAPGTSATASCGISAAGTTNYVSVTPATPTATVSSSAEYTSIAATHVPYLTGKKYTFTPPAPTTYPNLPTAVSPLNAATGVLPNSTLNWADGGGWTESFKLYFGTTNPPAVVGDIGYVTSWDPPGDMPFSTQYYWKVEPYNNAGGYNTTQADPWAFTTSDPPLTGTKTIGGTSPTYATFTAAINALNAAGVGAGGVIFEVRDGTYNENPPAITVSGTSGNQIKFQAATGANPVVTPAGGTGTFGFKLDGADWVTFDNIDVTGPNTLIYGYWLANGAQNNTIKNSQITVPYGSSTNYGIYSLGIADNPNSYLTVLNNTVVNPYNGIYLTGSSTAGSEAQSLNVQGNTLTGIRNYGVYMGYALNTTIQYNNVGFYASGTTSYYGIYVFGSASTYNVHHNTISGGYTSSTVYALYNSSGVTTWANNEVTNLYNTGSSTWYGMYATGNNTIWSNNSIHGISNSGTGSVYGAYITTGNHQFNDNLVYDVQSGSTSLYGMYVIGGTTHNIYNNKIYNLRYSGTGAGVVAGMYLSSATTTVYNNMIYDLRNTGGTTAPQVRGISVTGGTSHKIYYNSLLLDASSTATNFGTACLYTSSSTGGLIDLRNNIFVNRSTPRGTGLTAVIHKSTTGFTVFGADTNRNLYYAGSPDATHVIGLFSTTAYPALADYRAAAGAIEQGSYTEENLFYRSSVSPYDLRISESTPTQVESGGANITGITTDMYGTIRQGNPGYAGTGLAPDLGANEGEFTSQDLASPVISYTPLTQTISTGDRSLTGVVITDATGVDIEGGEFSPRIYYTLEPAGDWFSNPGTYVSGTTLNSVWDFTILAADLTGLAVGSTVYYYVIAQDTAPRPNVGSMPAGAVADDVNNVTTHPVNPNSYLISPSYSGDILVGTGNTYTSLTEDGPAGLFKTLNSGVITGNINVIVSSDLTETGAIALNQTTEAGSGNYSITIKPSEAVLKTISGSLASNGLIRFNDADRVTIDGRFGGSGRYLAISNTATTSPVAVSYSRSSAYAENNTVRNCLISTGSNASTSMGVDINEGVRNISVVDNIITKAYYGVDAYASTTYPIQNLTVSSNTIGDGTTDTNSIGNIGIRTYYCDGFTLSGNTIVNLKVGSNARGIYCYTGSINGSIINNVIDRITYTGTTGYGGKGIDLDTSATSNIVVANNMISGLSGDGWNNFTSDSIVGIRLLNSTGNVGLYYNSVYLSGNAPRSTQTYSAALYIPSGAANITLINNIFQNEIVNATTTTSKAYAIYSAAANTAFTTINNNDYFVSGTQGILGYLGADVSSLSAWRTATGQDAASVFGDPLFTSVSDLHIQSTPASWAESKGQYLALYPTDIDGNPRWNSPGYSGTGTATDIGADEGNFTAVTPAVMPTAQPTNLVLVPGSTTVNGSFDAAVPPAEAYLVVASALPLTAGPVNEMVYTVGSIIGNGTVAKIGPSLTFGSTGLNNSSLYYYTVFSYNTTGAGAPLYLTTDPLVNSVTTLGAPPANPASVVPSAVSNSQINVVTTANGVPNNVLLAYSLDNVWGTPLSNVNYVAGNTITGGGIVLSNGAAGTYMHTGLETFTTYYYKAWSVSQDGAYYLYSAGIVNNTFTATTLPYSQNFDASSSLPLGWSKLGTLGSYYISSSYSHSPTRSMYVIGSTTIPGAMGALPPVSVSSTPALLKFWARGSSATTGILEVGYLTTPGDQNSFVSIQNVPVTSTTFAEYIVPLGVIDGTKFFAIRSIANTTAMYFDDVSLEVQLTNDLAATQISGPFQGVVNTQFSYQVTVANMGTAAQNAYTVELHSVETRALLTSISVTDALAPLGTAVHTLNWTPTTVADYNIYAKVVLTGDADTTNNQTANKAVGVYNPLSMPINETWDAFAGNHWTNTADGHWSVVSSGGNPGKAMKFSYSPTVTDYTSALNSFVIDASAATGVRFKYDYYLDNHATTTIEGMRVEVYNGTAWTEIDNVTNQGGDIPWTTKTWDISSLVAGQMFKVRFITYGANSYNINYWYFDNIRFDVIPALLPQPTDLVVTQTGTNVNLNWTGTSTEGYKVYQSDDPYTWTGEGTLVATNTYSIPVGANPKKFFKVTGYFNSGAVPAPPTKQYRYNGSELIEPARAALFGEIERRK